MVYEYNANSLNVGENEKIKIIFHIFIRYKIKIKKNIVPISIQCVLIALYYEYVFTYVLIICI